MAMYAMFNSFLHVYQRVMTWFCERFGWSPRGPFMTSTTSPSGCFWGMWCPPVINWLIIPMNTIDYRYITCFNHSYWSYLHQLSYRTGAPPCTILFVQSQTYIYICSAYGTSWIMYCTTLQHIRAKGLLQTPQVQG